MNYEPTDLKLPARYRWLQGLISKTAKERRGVILMFKGFLNKLERINFFESKLFSPYFSKFSVEKLNCIKQYCHELDIKCI